MVWVVLAVRNEERRAWVAQPFKHLTLDFGSGHDPAVHEIKPVLGSTLTAWSLGFSVSMSLSLSLSACPPLVISFSLKNK